MAESNGGISSVGTMRTFIKVGTCSETLFNVVDRAFEHPLELEEHASMPLAGGINQLGYQCGMLWGATLAAGAQAYRLHGPGPQAETQAVAAAQRLVATFRDRHEYINCLDLTDIPWKKPTAKQILKFFVMKGGPVKCLRMAAGYAPIAFRETNAEIVGLGFQNVEDHAGHLRAGGCSEIIEALAAT